PTTPREVRTGMFTPTESTEPRSITQADWERPGSWATTRPGVRRRETVWLNRAISSSREDCLCICRSQSFSVRRAAFSRVSRAFSRYMRTVPSKLESAACTGYRTVLIITSWKIRRPGLSSDKSTPDPTNASRNEKTPFQTVSALRSHPKMFTASLLRRARRPEAAQVLALGIHQDLVILVHVLENTGRTLAHADEGVVDDVDGQSRLPPQQFVEAAQLGAAAGHHDALVHEIGGQFRRRLLQGAADRFDDGVDRLGQRL